MTSFAAVEREIDDAIGAGVFPGAVLLVRDAERAFYLRAFGSRRLLPEPVPMHEETLFDVSSLTKPMATTSAILTLVRDGRFDLDERVARLFPAFGVHGKATVTYRQLLSHASGLRAWRPFFEEIRNLDAHGRVNFLGSTAAKQYVIEAIEKEQLEVAAGTRAIYSDLGFVMLGAAVEAITGMTLDRYCRTHVFTPLGLSRTRFRRGDVATIRTIPRRGELSELSLRPPEAETIAATEVCPWRGEVLCGVVHDDNCYAMGGVAGHAGLFSTARDIDRFLVHLRDCYFDRATAGLVPSAVLREFWSPARTAPESTWCLGWDTPSPLGSSAGCFFPYHSVGHLGFTGVSMWLDLERERHVVLLTNRVHPSRHNDAIRAFRPVLHDLVHAALR